jgi:flagellar motor switch protein FliM
MSDQILTQEEINALLQAMDEDQITGELIPFDSKASKIKPYDFMRPDKFSKDQLRTLQMMHDSFARNLQTSLSSYLRTQVGIELLKVEELPYEEFFEQVHHPSIVSIIGLSPMNGTAIIEVSPTIGFAIIDRLLGGPGIALKKIRPLTEIEQTVIRRIIDRALVVLRESWEPVVEIEAKLQRIELNFEYTQLVPPKEMTVLISFLITLGNVSGRINMCFPYTTLESMASKLKAQVWFASDKGENDNLHQLAILNNIARLRLPIVVELGSGDISISELVNLEVGDMIKLDRSKSQPLFLKIGSKTKFLCRPGKVGSRLAVELLEPQLEEED